MRDTLRLDDKLSSGAERISDARLTDQKYSAAETVRVKEEAKVAEETLRKRAEVARSRSIRARKERTAAAAERVRERERKRRATDIFIFRFR